jgi:hypothetical protein
VSYSAHVHVHACSHQRHACAYERRCSLSLTQAARGSRTRPCAESPRRSCPPTVFGVDVLSHSHSHPHPHSRTSPACLSTQQPAHTSTHTHTCTRAHNHTARTPCTSSSDCAPDHLLQAQLLDLQHTSRHASTLAPSLSRSSLPTVACVICDGQTVCTQPPSCSVSFAM